MGSASTRRTGCGPCTCVEVVAQQRLRCRSCGPAASGAVGPAVTPEPRRRLLRRAGPLDRQLIEYRLLHMSGAAQEA